MSRGTALLAAAVVALGGGHRTADAQGVRGWAGTTVQGVELRPIAAAEGGCVAAEPCYLPGSKELSLVGTQDVSLTAWGFGVRGLSATVFVRGRAGLGDAVWPRSDDHFDALLAYGQLVRGPWAFRLGRQEIRSGLGFSSFDGGWAERRLGAARLTVFGGRSLARGLRDPENEALRGLDDFVPDQGLYLWGGSATTRWRATSVGARYQRELLADRSGLASERASLDANTAFPFARFGASVDWDFGQGRLGKSQLTATAPIGDGRWLLSATARRYVPYFSLSTIWGFFEPVAYHEVGARVGWSASELVGAWAAAGWRRYGDTETTEVLRALEDTGWRGEAGAAWTVSDVASLEGRYQLEWVPGGFLSSADASLRWAVLPDVALALSGTSFQQIEQYRLGDGRALGAGVSVDASLTERLSFAGGGSLLRHRAERDGATSPWNQSRFWSTLRVRLGGDPGLANRVSR